MELKIEYMALDKLKPYEKNPRKNDNAIDAVASSISQFGFKNPIVIDKDNVIVCGHTRYKAAKKLKLDTVPCVIADDLTDEQIKAYRLADNKVSELAEWDIDLLGEELDGIFDIDMRDFGFDLSEEEDKKEQEVDTYEEKMKEFNERMASGDLSDDDEEYQEFLAKFEAKKTTDDCYTPPIVYEAVADYVMEKYGLDKNNFVRPFVPNGDYQAEVYNDTDIVVDNPPFSIMSEIIRYYNDNGIKFFLFAPHLTIFSASSSSSSCIICGVTITYENGANIATSFVTNLEECAFRSSPTLYEKIKVANNENLRQTRKELPKYSYPLSVMTSNMLTNFSRYGIDFEVAKDECCFIRQLDMQKEYGKTLFGSGYLISERKRAEREKAEREKVDVWTLSEREIDIIRGLK